MEWSGERERGREVEREEQFNRGDGVKFARGRVFP